MINETSHKKNLKMLFTLIMSVVIFASSLFYFGVFSQAKTLSAKDIKIEGVYLETPQKVGNFKLTDNQGNVFNKESLTGQWTMLFFGFTNCGMVCPTTMSSLNQMYKTLQKQLPDKKLPQIVLVTVDPERDTLTKMDSYVKAFNSHFKGARGSEEETINVEKIFHIAAEKVQTPGAPKDHYSVNHSAEILLINPQGKIQAYFSYPSKPERLVEDYKLILNNYIG